MTLSALTTALPATRPSFTQSRGRFPSGISVNPELLEILADISDAEVVRPFMFENLTPRQRQLRHHLHCHAPAQRGAPSPVAIPAPWLHDQLIAVLPGQDSSALAARSLLRIYMQGLEGVMPSPDVALLESRTIAAIEAAFANGVPAIVQEIDAQCSGGKDTDVRLVQSVKDDCSDLLGSAAVGEYPRVIATL